MRGLMISFTIIMFVFSVSVTNTLNNQHAGNRQDGLYAPLFLWTANAPYNTTDSQFTDVQSGGMNASIQDLITPAEQETGFIDTILSSLTFAVKGALFMANILINSTVNFHHFIHDMGGTGTTFVPMYLAHVISFFVNIAHSLTIIQFLSNRVVDRGA